MSSETIYHYVYRITNLIEKRHYYGSRSSKTIPENDLGIKYFSSSCIENFISDQKQNPSNYRYKIIKRFDDRKSALEFEIFLHKKFQVSSNEKFYNLSCQTSSKFSSSGLKFPDKHQKGINNSQFGTFWIHNKEQKKNTKIKKGEEIPDGWEKGRVCNWDKSSVKELKISKCIICQKSTGKTHARFCEKHRLEIFSKNCANSMIKFHKNKTGEQEQMRRDKISKTKSKNITNL